MTEFMFFALSKVLGFFLVPSNIMAGLGLGGIALLAIGYVGIGRWMLAASIVIVGPNVSLPIRSSRTSRRCNSVPFEVVVLRTAPVLRDPV